VPALLVPGAAAPPLMPDPAARLPVDAAPALCAMEPAYEIRIAMVAIAKIADALVIENLRLQLNGCALGLFREHIRFAGNWIILRNGS